jgi:phosphoglycolate phosphatase-like HAD superfamily hydrolase
VLQALSAGATLYVASATPQKQLAAQIARRAWQPYVSDAFGYPAEKAERIAHLLARHRVSPDRLLVVGDGVSDAAAARTNGCPFHLIGEPADLARAAQVAAPAYV